MNGRLDQMSEPVNRRFDRMSGPVNGPLDRMGEVDDNPASPTKGSSSPDSSVSSSEDGGLVLMRVRFGEAAAATLPALEGVLPPTTEGVKETPFNFLLDAALIAARFLEDA